MSAGFPFVNPRFKAFVFGTNAPLNGGKVYFYLTGTALATLQSVFAEIGCTTPLANPVILDTNGESTIFGNAIYDIVVKNSADVTQYTITGVSFSPASSATGTSSAEWLAQTGALTYISTTSFTIVGNQTAIFTPGRRIQVVVTAGTLYGTVKTSAYSTSTTVTVDLDSGNLDSGLSAVSIGILNAVNTSIPVLALPTMAGGTTAYTIASIQRAPILKGARIQAIINATNTGASTLAVNGGSVTNIKKQGTVALVAGDMQINGIADLEYDGTNWQLLNPFTIATTQLPSGGIPGSNLIGIGSANVVVVTNQGTPANITLPAGDWVIFANGTVGSGSAGSSLGTIAMTINGTTVFSLATSANYPTQGDVVPVSGALIVTSWAGGALAVAVTSTHTITDGPVISVVAIRLT